MKNSIIAIAALAASAAAQVTGGVGSAVIVNKCDYSVALQNVPAADGGYTEIDETLEASTGTYTQQWTALTNGDGWSMKLWPITGTNTASTNDGNIMQYEYTYDPVAGSDWEYDTWYDLSDVNGNPWNGNWEITADGNCDPKQQAYMYATDDAYGEQMCLCNSTITVTLCSGGDTSSPSSASSAAASTTAASSTAASSTAASSTTSAYTSTTSVESSTVATSSAVATSSSSDVATSTTKTHHGHGFAEDDVVATATPTPTTLATLVSTTSDGVVIVTDVDYTTVVATTTVLDKRSEHMHKREHLHQHGARHPHARQ